MSRRSERKDRRSRERNRTERRQGGGPRPESTVSQLPELFDRIPSWLPPALFALLTVALFREFIFSSRMLYGEDTLTLGYMARAFYAEALRTTGFPLWNPLLLGGTPFLESLAGGDSLYPPSLLLLVLLEPYRALGWKLVLHVFLAGCAMYLWLRLMGVSRGGSLVGGTAYLLAPYLVTLVLPGHDGKMFVTALAPLLFASCEWSFRRRDLLPLGCIAAVVALVLLTTHFQMAYFLFGGAGAYMIFRTVQAVRGEGWERNRALRHFGLFLGFSFLGAGVASVQLLPAVQYVMEHSRRTATTVAADPGEARAWAASWSLHPEEVVSLVVPEFVGNTRADADWAVDTYWGRNVFKLNHEYLGLAALLLASLAFLGPSALGIRWFLAGMGGGAVLFALGANTPFWSILYTLLPGVSLFRAPSMAIFLTGFAVATLAGMGVDRGARALASGEAGKVLRVLGGGTLVLALGLVLVASGGWSGIWFSLFSPEMTPARAEALARAEPFMVRGFLLATALGGLLWAVWWALAKGVMLPRMGLGLLVLLVVADEFRVSDPFVLTLEYEAFATPDPNHEFLLDRARRESPFRVFSMMQGGQDVAPAMFGLELAAGHHPNDLARYRELIGMEGSGIPEHLAFFHPNVLRLLNVRYILWPDGQFGPIDGAEPLNQVAFMDGTVYASVYGYPGLGRARVVGEAVVVPEVEVLDVILGDHPLDYDPSLQTVLPEPPPIELGGAAVRGTVEWVERSPNRLVLEAQSSGPALLVLSENWFPGWEATVGGQPVEVLRADHTLRAVPLPGGSHRVEFRYRAPMVRAGLAVTLLSTLLLAGLMGATLRRRGNRGSPPREVPGEAPE